MITLEDIEIIGTYSGKLKSLDEEIKKIMGSWMNKSVSFFNYYLFKQFINKDYTVKCESVDQLISNEYYDKKIYPIESNKYLREQVVLYKTRYDELKNLRKEYWRLRKIYGQTLERVTDRTTKMLECIEDEYERNRMTLIRDYSIRSIKYSEGTKLPSSGEAKVLKILDMVSKQYDFYYIYMQRWHFCRDANPLEYDFYCMLFYDGYFYHWVIEFDGDQHYKETGYYNHVDDHRRDILKQYYLAELNVHLLRIRESSFDETFEKIESFMNSVIKTDKYLSVGRIAPIKKYFESDKCIPGLEHFCQTILDRAVKLRYIHPKRKFCENTKEICIDREIECIVSNANYDDLFENKKEKFWIFVDNDLMTKYGFIEEEFDEQEVLNFVYGKINKMSPSKVLNKNCDDFSDQKEMIELFMLIDEYNVNIVDMATLLDESSDDGSSDEFSDEDCIHQEGDEYIISI